MSDAHKVNTGEWEFVKTQTKAALTQERKVIIWGKNKGRNFPALACEVTGVGNGDLTFKAYAVDDGKDSKPLLTLKGDRTLTIENLGLRPDHQTAYYLREQINRFLSIMSKRMGKSFETMRLKTSHFNDILLHLSSSKRLALSVTEGEWPTNREANFFKTDLIIVNRDNANLRRKKHSKGSSAKQSMKKKEKVSGTKDDSAHKPAKPRVARVAVSEDAVDPLRVVEETTDAFINGNKLPDDIELEIVDSETDVNGNI